MKDGLLYIVSVLSRPPLPEAKRWEHSEAADNFTQNVLSKVRRRTGKVHRSPSIRASMA